MTALSNFVIGKLDDRYAAIFPHAYMGDCQINSYARSTDLPEVENRINANSNFPPLYSFVGHLSGYQSYNKSDYVAITRGKNGSMVYFAQNLTH